MALKDVLDEILNSEKLKKFVNEWKEGKAKDIRESYLIIAEKAHERLSKLINEWMEDESKMGENFHETFDQELLEPVMIKEGAGKPEKAWDFVKEFVEAKENPLEELKEKFDKGSLKIISGNPAWSDTMSVFKPAKTPSESGELLRELPDEVKDKIAKQVIKILFEYSERKSENYGEIKQTIKNKIYDILKDPSLGLNEPDQRIKEASEHFGPSIISSILHAIDPSFYIHIDKTLSQAFKISDENFPDILKQANELMQTYGLQNLCDVYWLFKAIEDIPPEENNPTLKDYFAREGFHFTDEQIFAFYNALKTKGFLILAGLSGTGKTKIAQLFAELLGKDKLCFLSVRPDWRDSTSLLGYYNPISEQYHSTKLLDFIQSAKKDLQNSYFLILDEMNLAHVEYYFADFLSVLESGRDTNGFTKEEIHLHSMSETVKDGAGNDIPEKIPLPPNLYIIGTVNIDETTYMFSPKVLDRAFTIEFRDVDLENYPSQSATETCDEQKNELKGAILEDLRNKGNFYVFTKNHIMDVINKLGDFKNELENLNKALLPYDLGFGYRVVDEIALFIHLAKQSKDFLSDFGGENERVEKAKDLAVLMKVLPKFHGPRAKLEKPLVEVLKWCSNKTIDKTEPEGVLKELFNDKWNNLRSVLMEWDNHIETFKYPLTSKKVTEMLARLREIGFTSFM
jgi:hypothetical protein